MKNKHLYLGLMALSFGFASCSDDDETTPSTNATANLIIADFGPKVAIPVYQNLHDKAMTLQTKVNALKATPTQANLEAAQSQWYAVRTAWEQSECMLFGPVATEGLDPAIDTWPVSNVELDSLLNTTTPFTETLIESLGEGLKGFHPIEYLLFGISKTRTVTELSARQLDYMVALTNNLVAKTEAMHHGWMVSGGNYATELANAGKGSATYPKKVDAMLEIAGAIAGIIDEVANGKIEEPLAAQKPELEESPFSLNSWQDFKDNIEGAQNVYMGKVLGQTSTSLHDFVLKHNASLDAQLQQKFASSVANLGSYTTPFGQAILTQKPQVQATQSALKALHAQLEDELFVLIQQQVKD